MFGEVHGGRRFVSVLILLVGVGGLFLYNWIMEVPLTAHVMPAAERQDIEEILNSIKPTREELLLLSKQTGLGMAALEHLWQQGEQQKLLQIQEIYFAPVAVREAHTTPITVSEWIASSENSQVQGMPLVDIEDGDILITKNSRFLGWRNGHAGLVVDAEKGLVLEALMLGSDSRLCDIHKWETYPSFVVLRLKEEMKPERITRSEDSEWAEVSAGASVSGARELAVLAADYAAEHLVGIEYDLLSGLNHRTEVLRLAEVESGVQRMHPAEPTLQELATPAGTHCAHLVWYAYLQAGIDLDSDGGFVVTPDDILHSPYLEVVQEYGYGGLETVRNCKWGNETEEP